MRSMVLAISIVFALAVSVRADDAKDLNDTWKPVEGTGAGATLSKEFLDSVTLTITDGAKYKAKVGEMEESGTFKFDATKTPKTMEIKIGDGPNKDKTLLAIYELSGDTLKVCYDTTGKEH